MLYGQHWWLGVGFIVVPVYAMRMAVVTHERMLAAYKQGVELLGRIMQEAHPYTHGHLHRVARWAKKIAEDMQLPAGSMQHIEDAAILHDIGKVAVDDRVLNKVGKLTDDDWAMIRRHPVTGADLVIRMSVMGKVAHWIRHHHERPDGKGYPGPACRATTFPSNPALSPSWMLSMRWSAARPKKISGLTGSR